MRNCIIAMILIIGTSLASAGCGKVGGPRFWWDDRSQQRLPDEFALPPDVGAPAEYSYESEPASPVGDDLTEDNLRDYRTNLDQEEEKRKSESSLLDF